MNKHEIFKKYRTIPSNDYKCDNCYQVCEYVLNVGPAFKPYDICEYCFLKDFYTLRNVRDMINTLRLVHESRLEETIDKMIYYIDKETRID